MSKTIMVEVYWNLHKKCWSVRDAKTRRILAHEHSLRLNNVRFKVSEAGRERVRREGRKNVHAFVVGEWVKEWDRPTTLIGRAVYNPYLVQEFVFVAPSMDAPVMSANKTVERHEGAGIPLMAFLAANKNVYLHYFHS
jgi:hypothetical protein